MARQTTKQLLNNGYGRILNKADDGEPETAAELAASVSLDWEVLVNPTAEQLEAVTRDGSRRVLTSLGVTDEDITNQVFEVGVEQARDRAAELVGMKYNEEGELVANDNAEFAISETTRADIRAAVTKALEDGVPAADLGDSIADMAAFSPARAEMIARTEIVRSNNLGHMAAFKGSGVVKYKEWSTSGDDDVDEDICQPNEDQGAIPLDDEFESGDTEPPGHPNCRCTLVAVVGEDAAEADEADDEGDNEE